jgi:FtsP/CotA-like multicopper oxidase with cupredoxin domain
MKRSRAVSKRADETKVRTAVRSDQGYRARPFPRSPGFGGTHGLVTAIPTALAVLLLAQVSFSQQKATADTGDTPPQLVLRGQHATCTGLRHKTFNIEMKEVHVRLSDDIETVAWAFNGTVPGPVLEACVGDTVTFMLTNHGSMAHGLDTHAFQTDAKKFGPVAPGATLKIENVVKTPGVFMYHCANGEMTDQHIKMSMSGAMIVYPRPATLTLAPAKELVVVQGSAYGEPNEKGLIEPDSRKMEANTPTFYFFNGRLDHKPIHLKAGQHVRLYFVNTSPYVSSVHVIGTILDRAHASGNPRNTLYDVQTFGVEDGNGAIIEFTVPEAGTYLLVDHDHLSYLPTGFVMPFTAK